MIKVTDPAILARDIPRAYVLYVFDGWYRIMEPNRMVNILREMCNYYEEKNPIKAGKIEGLIDKIRDSKLKRNG
jgi:hypothetical protein